MANVNIRIDDNLKKQAEGIFSQLGLNMSTAMTIFLKETVRYRGIPFELRLPDSDTAYLEKSVSDYNAGKKALIVKSLDELEKMADE